MAGEADKEAKYEFLVSSKYDGSREVKSRDIWEGFKEYTTAHGVPHLDRARGPVKKTFWGVITLGMIAGLLYNLTSITVLFFSYNVDVTIKLLHVNELTFPAVTICNMSPVKKTLLDSWSPTGARRRKRSAGGDNSTESFASSPEPTMTPPGVTGDTSDSCCCTCCFSPSQDTLDDITNACGSCDANDGGLNCPNHNLYTSQPQTTTTPKPTTTTTPAPSEPQKINGSSFPERVQPREDFLQEEKLTENLAGLTLNEKTSLGFGVSDLIIDCKYAGADCFISEFATFYSSIHGNCYIFNSGWNKSRSLHMSTKAGRRHGLHMIINIMQDEYVKEVGDTAGIRLVIHSQSRMPFPEDEGITVSPGHSTSIGLRQVLVQRKGKPFGNCTSPAAGNTSNNVFEELYPVNYSSTACQKTCYQKHVISACGCADSYYPKYGAAFDYKDYHICSSANLTQDDCKYGVMKKFQQNELHCHCPSSCSETTFSPEVSVGQWPSNVQKDSILTKLSPRLGDLFGGETSKYEENLIKLEVYYEEFNFEVVSEREAYSPGNYLSDIGGVLGLWVGFSMLTITEFVELAMDLALLNIGRFFCAKKIKNFNKPGGNSGPMGGVPHVSSFHMQDCALDRTDFPQVENSGGDTDRSSSTIDRKRKKQSRHKPKRGNSFQPRHKISPSSDYGSDTSADTRSPFQDRRETSIAESVNPSGYSYADYVEDYPQSGNQRRQGWSPSDYPSRESSSDWLELDRPGMQTARDIHLSMNY